MQAIDYGTLTTLAEVGISIIGIAGLVAVFLARGTLHTIDRVRFIGIVLPAAMVPTSAFLAIWLARHIEQHVSVWQYSSAIALGFFLAFNGMFLMVGYGPRSDAFRQLRLVVHPVSAWLTTAIVPINLALLTTNTLSWPFSSNQTAFELFLMLALIQAVVQFTSMVLFRPLAGPQNDA